MRDTKGVLKNPHSRDNKVYRAPETNGTHAESSKEHYFGDNKKYTFFRGT